MDKRQLWLAFEMIMAVYLLLSCCVDHTDLPKNIFENKNKTGSGKKMFQSYAARKSPHSNQSDSNFGDIEFFFYVNSNNIRIHHYFFCRNYLYWF